MSGSAGGLRAVIAAAGKVHMRPKDAIQAAQNQLTLLADAVLQKALEDWDSSSDRLYCAIRDAEERGSEASKEAIAKAKEGEARLARERLETAGTAASLRQEIAAYRRRARERKMHHPKDEKMIKMANSRAAELDLLEALDSSVKLFRQITDDAVPEGTVTCTSDNWTLKLDLGREKLTFTHQSLRSNQPPIFQAISKAEKEGEASQEAIAKAKKDETQLIQEKLNKAISMQQLRFHQDVTSKQPSPGCHYLRVWISCARRVHDPPKEAIDAALQQLTLLADAVLQTAVDKAGMFNLLPADTHAKAVLEKALQLHSMTGHDALYHAIIRAEAEREASAEAIAKAKEGEALLAREKLEAATMSGPAAILEKEIELACKRKLHHPLESRTIQKAQMCHAALELQEAAARPETLHQAISQAVKQGKASPEAIAKAKEAEAQLAQKKLEAAMS
eukprot:7177764-Prymnesium_polylepis.1